MRTVRSSSRLSRGGLPQCMLGYNPPGADPPQDQAPPPGPEPPTMGPGCPPGSRPPWGTGTPLWTDTHL